MDVRNWTQTLLTSLVATGLVAAGLGLASCATTQSSGESDSLTEETDSDPGFFDEIPAQPLYIVASLDDGAEKMKRYSVESGGGSILTLWQSFMEDAAEEELEEFPALAAFVDEFEDVETLEDFRELGLEPLAPSAVYALGGLPVGRVHLADQKKFKEFVKRFEREGEIDVDVRKRNGVEVHVFSPESLVQSRYNEEDLQFHIAMAIRDGELVTTTYPSQVEGEMLDHISGATTPEETMDDASALRTLNRKYGYESFMQSGWVDIEGIVEVLTEQSEPTALGKRVMRLMDVQTVGLEAPCDEEVSTLIEQVPRFVMGTKTFSRDQVAVSTGVEIESDISKEIGNLGAGIPAYGTDLFETSWLSFGMGVDVEKYVDFGMDRASKVVNEPYECDRLEGLNQGARRMTQVSGMIPPALRQIRSASFIVNDIEFAESMSSPPEVLKAMAVVRARNPQAILAQLRTVVPGLRKMNIEADGVPVSLDQLASKAPAVDAAHLAYTDNYIGASIGTGTQDTLAEFLENPEVGANSPLLSAGLDLGRVGGVISERLDQFIQEFAPEEAESQEGDEEISPEDELGMSFLELHANEHGMFFDYRLNTPGGSSSE